MFGLVTSPLRSKLFLLAGIATLAGAGMIGWAGMNDEAPGAWASWCVKVGASFIAAFVFAYLLKRAMIAALLIGGVLSAVAVALNKLGLGVSSEHMDTIDREIHAGTEAVQSAADSVWQTVKAHLPSSGAAGVGLFTGARHRLTPS